MKGSGFHSCIYPPAPFSFFSCKRQSEGLVEGGREKRCQRPEPAPHTVGPVSPLAPVDASAATVVGDGDILYLPWSLLGRVSPGPPGLPPPPCGGWTGGGLLCRLAGGPGLPTRGTCSRLPPSAAAPAPRPAATSALLSLSEAFAGAVGEFPAGAPATGTEPRSSAGWVCSVRFMTEVRIESLRRCVWNQFRCIFEGRRLLCPGTVRAGPPG